MDPSLALARGMQVCHSLNVVAELPRYVDDSTLPIGLRVAALDAFFLHVRLLVEFLVKNRDPRRPAIHRDDYAPGFHLGSVDSALYQRLEADFEYASRHVAHFSVDRVPTAGSPGVERVDGATVTAYAVDVLRGMAAFVAYMQKVGNQYAGAFADRLTEAQSRRGRQ